MVFYPLFLQFEPSLDGYGPTPNPDPLSIIYFKNYRVRCPGLTLLLLRLMAVQNPYVDCLNVLQAETLLANYPVLGLYRSTSHPRIGRLYCDESRHKTIRRQEEDNANSVIKNEYTTIRYEGYRQIITNKNEPIIIMNTHNK